jgi:hypothetical protein
MTPSPKTPILAAALAGLALTAGAGSAQAADGFAAVTGGHRLVTFHSDTIPALSDPVDVAGLPGGERLVALDARPGGAGLLALGVSGTLYGIQDAHASVVAGFGAALLPGTRTATLSVSADGRSARVIANGRDKTIDLTTHVVTADVAAPLPVVTADAGADGVLRGVDPQANTVVSLDPAGPRAVAPLGLKAEGLTAATTASDGTTWITTGVPNHPGQSRLLRYDPRTNTVRAPGSYLFSRLDALAATGTVADDTRPPKVSVRIPRQSVRDALRHRGFIAIVTTSEPGQTVMSARLGKAYRGFGFATAFERGPLRVLASEGRTSIRRLAGKRLRLHLAIHDWAGNTVLVDRFFTLRR